MTDAHDPLDELASAHLDGETTPEEAARIEADPTLRARVEELRRVRLADDDAASVDVRREAVISAALAAYDDELERSADAGSARVRPLATVVAARHATRRRTLQLVGIAAALILLALTVPLLANLGGSTDDQDDAATTAMEAPASDDAATEAAGSADRSAADTSGPLAGLPQLGSVQSWPELADAVAAARQPGASPNEASTTAQMDAGAAESLATATPPCPATATARFLAVADFQGRSLLVQVVADDAGVERIQGLDPQDCALVLEIPIDG